jgi:hypothetical protein
VKQPPLSNEELTRVVDHLQRLSSLINHKAQKYVFDSAPSNIAAAVALIRGAPHDIAKLLGGYFVRPERFIQYLYGCQLLIDCLEVAIARRRSDYLEDLFGVNARDIETINNHVSIAVN